MRQPATHPTRSEHMSTDASIPAVVGTLPNQYAARLPAADADHFRAAIAAGEYAWALQELTTTLVLVNAPITSAELDQLGKLAEAVGFELTALDALVPAS